MQVFISIFKYILQSNVINFILMLVILFWLVGKLNLGKSFEDSVKLVEESIKKSDTEKFDSQKKLEDAKALIGRLPEDISSLKQASKDKGEIFKSEIEADTKKTISSLSKNIGYTIDVEEKKFSHLLTKKTTLASVKLARLHIIELLDKSPELHNKFILESLDELDRVEL